MLKALKAAVRNAPVLGPALVQLRGDRFDGSSRYWDRRYAAGGNSGAGSYNRLAEFKADFLNRFVDEHGVGSVIEFGCGDGAQLRLASYPSYVGVDVSQTAVELCRGIFADDRSKTFWRSDELPPGAEADLALSLDVIYHLVEDPVFDGYMAQLFRSAGRFVIVYSSDMDATWPAKHVRHRRFTDWIGRNQPRWRARSTVKNAYPYDPADPEHTSFADFHVFERA